MNFSWSLLLSTMALALIFLSFAENYATHSTISRPPNGTSKSSDDTKIKLEIYDKANSNTQIKLSASKTSCSENNKSLIHGQMVICAKVKEADRKDYLPRDATILHSNRLPDKKSLWPSVGNGHIATVVNTDSIFMNGLYNGANVTSHRAIIPSTCNIQIISGLPTLNATDYALNLEKGIYTETYTGEGYNVVKTVYAHRSLTRLIVVEIEITTTTASDVHIQLTQVRGNASDDIDFKNGSSEIPDVSYIYGWTKEAEYNITGRTSVHVYSDNVPNNISINKQNSSTRYCFMTSVSQNKSDAYSSYKFGVQMFLNGSLFTSHQNAWNELWTTGRVDVWGNETIAKITYASLYYILSSLPQKRDDKWPFIGLSPGGLAHGHSDEDYNGHVFWDQDTWMFPAILFLHADISKILVSDRIRTLAAAKMNADLRGYIGAMYPWESAYSGLDVTPSRKVALYEHHITGDVAMAFKQYIMATNDTNFLEKERGAEAILSIAKFWSSRVVLNNVTRKYEIQDVMPPDEWHFRVNNSAYTNSVARMALLLPNYALGLIGKEAPKEYEDIANQMYIPFDEDMKYHPEFDGYKNGTTVKQADVILMGFPLMCNMTKEVRYNDLAIYEKVTPGGPAMTWGMFAIGWLELKFKDKAEKSFQRGMLNAQPPFYIWTENADGTGAVNFETGMGGYLQSLIFGYAGIRLHTDRVQFDPELPPTSTGMRLSGLDYLGSSFDFDYNVRYMHVTLTVMGNVPLFLVTRQHRHELHLEARLTVLRHEFYITPFHV